MKIKILASAVALVSVPALSVPKNVEFRECPKCDKRIRIDLEEGKAYVNLSRLDGVPKEKMAERAAMLLDFAKAKPAARGLKRPTMGWSSWNTFGIDISESTILETAKAMADNGLKDAGYAYVNIDDGFFCGHGKDGKLKIIEERFPNGMKKVADGIHALGMKAGIYSDAGINTCGSLFNDKRGRGSGLFGHDAEDCRYYFNECGYDFIKVDYCGGRQQKLDVRKRYTEISKAIKATGRDVTFNVCRWTYPGTWISEIADSWRTTGDIRAKWSSVRGIIGQNLYMSAYCSPGHYNDMDMLEVGNIKGKTKTAFGKHDPGLTPAEELTHFGMWCMFSSPLLIGCDVRKMPPESLALATNPYLLAMNQNDLGVQGYAVQREGANAYVFVKDAVERFGKSRFVALYNGNDSETEFTVKAETLDLGGNIDVFDLAEKGDIGSFKGEFTLKVAPHASRFFRFDAEKRLERKVYEAETAFLHDFQCLSDFKTAGTAAPDAMRFASGGVAVRFLGNRPDNWLEWRDVEIKKGGRRVFEISYHSHTARKFFVEIDGKGRMEFSVPQTDGRKIDTIRFTADVAPGLHTVRISNPGDWTPDIDKMTLAD